MVQLYLDQAGPRAKCENLCSFLTKPILGAAESKVLVWQMTCVSKEGAVISVLPSVGSGIK